MNRNLQPISGFEAMKQHTEMARRLYGASASVVVIRRDRRVVMEQYYGQHHHYNGASPVSIHSMFNVYSVRKTYVGIALATAIVEAKLSINQSIGDFLPHDRNVRLKDVTLKDLLTKSYSTDYSAIHIDREQLAAKAINTITGRSIKDLISERVWIPMGVAHSEWITVPEENLVGDYSTDDGSVIIRLGSDEGDEANLHVSARDLAQWGQLVMDQGKFEGQQLLPYEAFALIEALQHNSNERNPVSGWYRIEEGWYSIGATGCLCVLLPEYQVVAVRLLNRYTLNIQADLYSFKQALMEYIQA